MNDKNTMHKLVYAGVNFTENRKYDGANMESEHSLNSATEFKFNLGCHTQLVIFMVHAMNRFLWRSMLNSVLLRIAHLQKSYLNLYYLNDDEYSPTHI